MICDITGCPYEHEMGKDGKLDAGVLNHFGYLCSTHDEEWKKIIKDEELPNKRVPVARRRYVKYKLETDAKYVVSDILVPRSA